MRRFADVPLPPPRPLDLDGPIKNADKATETDNGRIIVREPAVQEPAKNADKSTEQDVDQPGSEGAEKNAAATTDKEPQKNAAETSDHGAANSGKPLPPAESANDNEKMRSNLLAKNTMIADVLPAIAGAGACGIAAPVLFKGIVLPDGKKVEIVPPATLRASLAAAVADWVREDLEPALVAQDDKLASIDGTGGYECRDRNRLSSGKLSEHAIGNAMDMRELVTAKGRHLSVIPDTADDPKVKIFRDVMKTSACTRFMTVLGPGADIFHAAHLHVDLEARHSGAHLCQWDMQFAAKASVPTH
ncbi:MAG TPA: extensin family protein [Methylovirgula sp.]